MLGLGGFCALHWAMTLAKTSMSWVNSNICCQWTPGLLSGFLELDEDTNAQGHLRKTVIIGCSGLLETMRGFTINAYLDERGGCLYTSKVPTIIESVGMKGAVSSR